VTIVDGSLYLDGDTRRVAVARAERRLDDHVIDRNASGRSLISSG
jgi:hypothetical protein